MIRDHDDCTVQFAHHTVRQYLLSDAAGQRKETFAYTVEQAEFFVGGMCLTYLSFSDFCTQIEVRDQEPKVERPPDLFKPGAALWIPNLLGVRGPLLDIPYRLLGGFSSSSSSSTPIIDFGKFMKPAIGAQDRKPSSELLERYSLLGYILDNWMYHTREFAVKSSEQHNKLQNLAKYQNLSFEFRPSGANQHKGPYGCKSCPPGIVSDAMAQKLPFMSLFHYAAELGHWPLMEPLVEDYCSHEDGDDHTLVTACRQGHYSIIKALTTRHTFNISNGKAVEAAAASGNEIILNHLLDLGESFRALRRGMGLYDVIHHGHIPLALQLLTDTSMLSKVSSNEAHPLTGRLRPMERPQSQRQRVVATIAWSNILWIKALEHSRQWRRLFIEQQKMVTTLSSEPC